MKKIKENVKLVYMTISEIQQKCKHDIANRCYFSDGTIAALNGYAFADGKKAKARIAKCRRAISDGWSICCPMVIHKVGKDMYITDGQGRLEAAIAENEKRMVCGCELKYNEIPVLLIERNTIEEMRADIKRMNNHNTNWTVSDTLHSEAVSEGGEKLARYETIRKIQDELDLVSDYIPRIILFGDHSNTRHEVVNVKMRENYEFVKEMFKRFYESQETRTNAKLRNKSKRVEVAIALNSVISHIVNACGYENRELYEQTVGDAMTKLINGISRMNDDDYMRTLGSRSVYVGSVFMDIIASRNRNKYITVAVSNFRAAKLGQLHEVA